MVRVLVWDEGVEMGPAVAAALSGLPGVAITLTGPADPDQGTSPAALAEAGVVVWWGGAVTATSLTDRAARRVVAAVTDRGLGFLTLSVGFPGKPVRILFEGVPPPAPKGEVRGTRGKGRVCWIGDLSASTKISAPGNAGLLRSAVLWCAGLDAAPVG